MDDGADIPRELVVGIYERIQQKELKSNEDHVTYVTKVEKSIVGMKTVSGTHPRGGGGGGEARGHFPLRLRLHLLPFPSSCHLHAFSSRLSPYPLTWFLSVRGPAPPSSCFIRSLPSAPAAVVGETKVRHGERLPSARGWKARQEVWVGWILDSPFYGVEGRKGAEVSDRGVPLAWGPCRGLQFVPSL